jgi:hypothetical protein
MFLQEAPEDARVPAAARRSRHPAYPLLPTGHYGTAPSFLKAGNIPAFTASFKARAPAPAVMVAA